MSHFVFGLLHLSNILLTIQYMKAEPVFHLKETLPNGLLVEAIVWRVPEPVPGCTHDFKYRLYCGREGQSLVRYDNERGKGDHKHVGDLEVPYTFVSFENLIADFIDNVERLGA